MSEQFEGGCLCGAVRFVATGQPESVAWCHCQSCRKHSGAPVSVFVAFDRTAYTVTKGEITKFNSSPGRWRGFCGRCGSTLTCEGEPVSIETHFHVGAFDQAARLQPTRHIIPGGALVVVTSGRWLSAAAVNRAKLLAASAVVGLWATAAGATDLRPEDAVRHIGETATVCGMVASAMFEADVQDKPTLLDLGEPSPHAIFTAVIYGDNRSKFGTPNLCSAASAFV
jgi:hypothetical protein